MDARETLARGLAAKRHDTPWEELRPFTRACFRTLALTVVRVLHADGFTTIHDSENHGPTLERAADFCWSKRDLLADAEKKQIEAGLTGRDYYGRRLEAEILSRAIRAMGEKK